MKYFYPIDKEYLDMVEASLRELVRVPDGGSTVIIRSLTDIMELQRRQRELDELREYQDQLLVGDIL